MDKKGEFYYEATMRSCQIAAAIQKEKFQKLCLCSNRQSLQVLVRFEKTTDREFM